MGQAAHAAGHHHDVPAPSGVLRRVRLLASPLRHSHGHSGPGQRERRLLCGGAHLLLPHPGHSRHLHDFPLRQHLQHAPALLLRGPGGCRRGVRLPPGHYYLHHRHRCLCHREHRHPDHRRCGQQRDPGPPARGCHLRPELPAARPLRRGVQTVRCLPPQAGRCLHSDRLRHQLAQQQRLPGLPGRLRRQRRDPGLRVRLHLRRPLYLQEGAGGRRERGEVI